jgi:hypothetical protein
VISEWLGGSRLTERDRVIVANVDKALVDGLALRNAWERAEAANSYAEQFSLARSFNAAERSIGFFDTFPTSSGDLPVMGLVQEMAYDQRKQAPAEFARDEFREFMCRYFLRISDYREPDAYVNEWPQPALSGLGQFLSWCPEEEERRSGFGYLQLYYKLRESGEIGKFRRREECAIVDVRDVGPKYDWVVVRVRIFDFQLRFQPLGPKSTTISVPIEQETYVVLSPDFITVDDHPGGDLTGRYGFGYALLQFEPRPSIFAYGPGFFRAGFQLVTFDVRRSGSTLVKMVFVANRPTRILRVDIDPFGWLFRVSDLVSLGLASRVAGPLRLAVESSPVRIEDVDLMSGYIDGAAIATAGYSRRDLCITRTQLERDMLLQHFMEHYRLISGSLLAWRQVPDWLDVGMLPQTALTGRNP